MWQLCDIMNVVVSVADHIVLAVVAHEFDNLTQIPIHPSSREGNSNLIRRSALQK